MTFIDLSKHYNNSVVVEQKIQKGSGENLLLKFIKLVYKWFTTR